jgi:hypothetical protein
MLLCVVLYKSNCTSLQSHAVTPLHPSYDHRHGATHVAGLMAQERQCATGRQPLLPLKECLCLLLTRGPQLLGQSLGLAKKNTQQKNKTS